MEDVILDLGKKGKKQISIDKELIDAIEKGRATNTYSSPATALLEIRRWCEKAITDGKITVNQADKAFNDSLEKSLSPVTYSGRFKIKGVETPRMYPVSTSWTYGSSLLR